MHLLKSLLVMLAAVLVLASCSTSKKNKTGYSGFGLDSITKEQLAKYAPPPPDPNLKNVIEKLVDIRSTTAGVVSNDGKSLFTSWNVTGSNQIWKLNGVKSFPIQLTGGEDASRLSGITPDNQWLVISRDSKGDENPGIYLMRTQGGPLKKIYYNPKHQTSLLEITPDSKALYYRTNDKAPSSYSIYKYLIQTDEHQLILDEPGIWTLSDVLGDQAILTLQKGSMNNEHYLLNLKTKEKKPLIGQNESEDFSLRFTGKAGEYFVLTNKVSDFRRIYLLKDGKLTPITPELKADVSRMVLSYNRKILAYNINNQGRNEARLMNAQTKKEIALPKLGVAIQTFLGSFSTNDRYLTLSTEHHDYPSRNYAYDLQTRKLTDWVVSSTPEIDVKGYVQPVLESYKAADGTDIPMFVWRSEKCKKEVCPVVVNFHGGPEAQFIPRFSPVTNFYTERGFIYVAPNVRGSDG